MNTDEMFILVTHGYYGALKTWRFYSIANALTAVRKSGWPSWSISRLSDNVVLAHSKAQAE